MKVANAVSGTWHRGKMMYLWKHREQWGSPPLKVIPFEAWTQPHGVELYDWVATRVLGTQSKVTKEYLEEMQKENIGWGCPGMTLDLRLPLYEGGDPYSTYLVVERNPTAGRNNPLTVAPLIVLTSPKSANMDDSGKGFLFFRAHGKMKIFYLSDESSNFKEMYFKISGASKTQPFYLNLEKKAKFSLYWRMGYRSPRPGVNELSEEERKAASLLRSVWG
ncbi:hypothetical protein PIB30_060576 [Stylosanthes scabra]|uniref:Uncharacterized protein n=1 Tax=Stylosanthes scabra TaxID=79078 RepID=A0ABU6WIY4_9FABA|nr:hypothetical protein [Stylosanthes scabra]